MLLTIVIVLLVVVLVVVLVGGLPNGGFAPQGWGYYPSGTVGLVLVVLLILLLLGRI